MVDPRLQAATENLMVGKGQPRGKKAEARDTGAEKPWEQLRNCYDVLFEQASDAIVIWGTDMKVVALNHRAQELSGLEREQIVGQSILSVLEEESVDEAKRYFRKMQKDGRSIPEHLLKIKCSGGTRIGEATTTPIKSGSKIIAFQTVIRDVTGRVRAQEALQASEEKTRAMFESVVDAITVTDLEGNITQVNNATLKIYGCDKPEEMVGRSGLDFLRREEHDKARQYMRKMLEEGFITGVEYTALKRDGSEYPIEASAAVIRDRDGNPTGFVSVAKDITERKLSEMKLRESEERFRTIFDNATDGILLADLDTKKFHEANRSFCKMLGYSPEELKELGVSDIHLEKDLPNVLGFFEKQAKKELTLAQDIPVRKKNGSIFYADINSSPVILGGRSYLMGVFRDVTARKLAEEQFFQSQRLESLGMFAAGLAHDFKEYISKIFGHASFLRNSLDSKSANYRRISDIAQAAQDATTLVDRLKAFSGKSTFHPTLMAVDAPLSETIRVLRRHIRPNIMVRVSLDARPGMVNTDYWQIQKAILNIMTNACDAMPSGGTLKVSTSQEMIDPSITRAHRWLKPTRHVVISISDTGMGMSSEVLDKIFDPFFTTKGPGKGAGLGLSIAYGIVKDHEGTIEVRSEISKGSVFKIYLPEVKA